MRSSPLFEIDGQRKKLVQWMDVFGVNRNTFHSRIKMGWTIQDALSKPVEHKHRKINREKTAQKKEISRVDDLIRVNPKIMRKRIYKASELKRILMT